jgi:hypothetical protein
MRYGITGHQHLDDPTAWSWVESEIDHILQSSDSSLVGISSLAVGADQCFARAVLRHSGRLVAVIPFAGYEKIFESAAARRNYDELLARATEREVLPRAGTDEASFLAAGQRVARLADLLVAVWDGEEAAGLGGTADIVRYAERRDCPVLHIHPIERRTYRR